jgi:hypothetical protein
LFFRLWTGVDLVNDWKSIADQQCSAPLSFIVSLLSVLV